MRPRHIVSLASVVLLGGVVTLAARPVAPGAAPAQGAPAAAAPQTPAPVPGGAPNAGATSERPNQPNFIGFERTPPPMNIPVGFTPLFNGMNLEGWHVSPTNHHGHTPDFHVAHGMIIGSQQPLGSGGILISDRKFKNFELYMEVKPDYGCDSGIFLRTTEWGAAYQVTMDYLPGGGMGNVIGEGGITGVGGRGRGARAGAAGAAGAGRGGAPGAGQGPRAGGPPATPVVGGIPLGSTTPNGEAAWMKVWKREDWNSVRVRMVGEVPHVTVWMNDVQITDFTDVANNAMFGMWEGPVAIQIHGGARCSPGTFWRWRTIAYRDLP